MAPFSFTSFAQEAYLLDRIYNISTPIPQISIMFDQKRHNLGF